MRIRGNKHSALMSWSRPGIPCQLSFAHDAPEKMALSLVRHILGESKNVEDCPVNSAVTSIESTPGIELNRSEQ